MSTDNITATIELARGGDTGAFAQIVRQYQSLVSGVLFSATGDFHKSEDFTQETFLIAWQKLGELRDPNHLAAWLCTIARNLVHRSHRKAALLTEPLTDDTGGLASAAHAPDDEMLRKEQSEFVWSAIGEMDEKYRETLVLYYRSGQSVREIASATASTEEAVRQRLVRARKSLKAKLEEMVGSILTDTIPGEVFTLTVMTALGAAMLTTTAQTAVAATTGTVATGTLATGGATTGKATGLAAFWTVLGPVAYFLWVFSVYFIGLWTQVRNAPTVNARRYFLYSTFTWTQYILVFYIALTLVMLGVMTLTTKLASIYGFTNSNPIPGIIVMGIMILAVVPLARRSRKHFKYIVETDLGLAEKPVKTYSNAEVARRIHSAFFVNFLLIQTGFGLALILPLTDGSSGVVPVLVTIGVATLVGLLYYGHCRFGRFLLESCCTESGMRNMPPFVEKPFETALGRTTVNPVKSMPTWLKYWFFGGLALFLAWGASFLDWSHPIPTALCIAGFVISTALFDRLGKRFDRNLGLGLSGLVNTFFCAMLMKIQCGTLSPAILWLPSATEGVRKAIYVGLIIMCILSLLGGIYHSILYLRRSRSEKLRRDEECDERIRLAIEKYCHSREHCHSREGGNPDERPYSLDSRLRGSDVHFDSEMETTSETPPFPKRWLRILFLYGVAILVLFCIVALIPNPYAHKKQLERNNDYTALIALEPDNAQWYLSRGVRQRGTEGAMADFDMAIKLKPDYALAYFQRAQTRASMADSLAPDEREALYLQSLADANEAMRLEPNMARHVALRARQYLRLGDDAAAERDFTEAIRLEPSSSAYYERANFFHYWKKDLQSALADYTKAIELSRKEFAPLGYSDTPLVMMYRARGEVYEKLGEPDKAAADFEKGK